MVAKSFGRLGALLEEIAGTPFPEWAPGRYRAGFAKSTGIAGAARPVLAAAAAVAESGAGFDLETAAELWRFLEDMSRLNAEAAAEG